MDCSDCDSSGLDSPNSSWSIVRLKEYLRRKKRPSKREKSRASWTWLSPPTSSPGILLCFFFVLLFFSLFLFLFSSSPACYAPYFSCTGTRSPTSIALLFLQSCLNAHCVLAYIACWPLDRRILHELYFACAATSRVPPAFDREWFHHLANGNQLHAFSQGRAFLCFVVQAHSIAGRPAHGDFKLRAQKKKKKKKKKKKTPMALHLLSLEATGFPCFAMTGNGRVRRLLGTRRKVKIFRRKRSLHRTVLSLTREFAPSSRRRATNQCFLSSLDIGKLWYDSEGLVLRPLKKRGTQQWSMVGFPKSKKRWHIKRETHTSQLFFAGDAPYLVPGQSLEKSSVVWAVKKHQLPLGEAEISPSLNRSNRETNW